MHAHDRLHIINAALVACGITKTVQNLEERSAEAMVGVRTITGAIDGLLAEYNWRFATKIEPLSLIAAGKSGTGASDFWRFTYQYPADSVRLHAVLPPSWRSTVNTGMNSDGDIVSEQLEDRPYIGMRLFETYTTSTGRVIVTNIEKAYARYVSNDLASDSYPPLFREALIYKLAASMLLSLQGSNEAYVGQLLQQSIRFKTLAIQADSAEGIETLNSDPFLARYRGIWH